MALYTLIFVPFFRWLLYHTRLYSLPSVLAFANLMLTFLPILASDVIVHPK